MDKESITSIFINPRNKLYCEYIINSGETHTKKYQDMYKFLSDLFPLKSKKIYDSLFGLRPFIILPLTDEFIELSFTELLDKEELRKKIKTRKTKEALVDLKQKEKEKQKEDNQKIFDKKIKNLSKKTLDKVKNFF